MRARSASRHTCLLTCPHQQDSFVVQVDGVAEQLADAFTGTMVNRFPDRFGFASLAEEEHSSALDAAKLADATEVHAQL